MDFEPTETSVPVTFTKNAYSHKGQHASAFQYPVSFESSCVQETFMSKAAEALTEQMRVHRLLHYPFFGITNPVYHLRHFLVTEEYLRRGLCVILPSMPEPNTPVNWFREMNHSSSDE
jgi:hypothetical protein